MGERPKPTTHTDKPRSPIFSRFGSRDGRHPTPQGGRVQSPAEPPTKPLFDIMVHHFPIGREVLSMAAGNSSTHQVQPIQRGRPAHHATTGQHRQWSPQNRPQAVSTGVGRPRRKACINPANKANAENNPPSISKHTGRGSVPFPQDISVCRSTPHKPPRRRVNDTHHHLPHRSRRPTLRCTGGTTRHSYPYFAPCKSSRRYAIGTVSKLQGHTVATGSTRGSTPQPPPPGEIIFLCVIKFFHGIRF